MIIHCYSNSQRVKLGGLNGDKKNKKVGLWNEWIQINHALGLTLRTHNNYFELHPILFYFQYNKQKFKSSLEVTLDIEKVKRENLNRTLLL